MATIPKHLLIREQLLQRVAEHNADAALPKERQLAEEFAVSRTTVRQALQSLTDDGLIYSIRGKGTFVSKSRISKGTKLTSFTEDMRGRGMTPSSRVLAASEQPATVEVARALELEPESAVYFLERVRLADGFPMALEELYLPVQTFPRLLDLDLESSLYDVMADRYRVKVTSARQRITATSVTGRSAELLGVKSHSSALKVSRVGIDSRGRLVEHAISIYRADRYDFELSIQR